MTAFTATTRCFATALVTILLAGCALVGAPSADINSGNHKGRVAGSNVRAYLLDLSPSSLGIDLVNILKQLIAADISTTRLPARLEIYGFSSVPSAPCDPVVVELAAQKNKLQVRALREDAPVLAAQKVDELVDCFTSPETGTTQAGSAIMEAIRTTAGRTRASKLVTVTDGCQNMTGTLPTCVPRVDRPGYAQEVVESLPARLLDGQVHVGTLVLVGLGRGAGGLGDSEILGLGDVFSRYGEALGMKVVIR